MIGSFFYDPAMTVEGVDSFSPSAGKPARFMELMHHHYRPVPELPVHKATKEDLYLVHDKAFVDGVFGGTVQNGFGNYDQRVPEACLWTIGGMVSASLHSANQSLALCVPVSGFHHAGYDFAGGYCTFNGLMVAAAKYLEAYPGSRVGILDCDFHYGDGTADILKKNPELAQHIIHRTSGKHFHGDYPEDEAVEFFIWLESSIRDMNEFGCDVVLYQAGADMSIHDPLGGILDDNQMRQRDRTVMRKVRSPLVWNLAGGYQKHDGDIHADPVLQLHRATVGESFAVSNMRSKLPRNGKRLRVEHDASVRQEFHDYLVSIGMAEQKTPPNHMQYNSSHVESLWNTWVAAVMRERFRK